MVTYSKSYWLSAMREQGFEIVERENGEALVVVDLNFFDVWLEDDKPSKEGAED